MRLHNFLNFESKALSRGERLSLILHAAQQAKEHVRSETAWQELDFVCHDCQAVMEALQNGPVEEMPWLDRRIERMSRVLRHYEDGFVRFNRRFWWVLFAIGLVLLVLAILYGSPSDPSAII